VFHRDNREAAQDLFWNFLQIGHVLLWNDYGIGITDFSRKAFFPSAHRSATHDQQGDFTRHSHVAFHRIFVKADAMRLPIVTPALGPSLGTLPSGTWM